MPLVEHQREYPHSFFWIIVCRGNLYYVCVSACGFSHTRTDYLEVIRVCCFAFQALLFLFVSCSQTLMTLVNSNAIIYFETTNCVRFNNATETTRWTKKSKLRCITSMKQCFFEVKSKFSYSFFFLTIINLSMFLINWRQSSFYDDLWTLLYSF